MLKKIVKKVIRYKSPLDAYRFHVDEVSEERIGGWAHKIDEEGYAPNIEIRHDNVILFATEANIMRDDLKAANIGTGQYGFSISPTALVTPQNISSIDIFVDGLKVNAKPFPLVVNSTQSSKEMTFFEGAMANELKRLDKEIEDADDNAMSVAIQNVASLSVRVEIIEEILTKHFAKK